MLFYSAIVFHNFVKYFQQMDLPYENKEISLSGNLAYFYCIYFLPLNLIFINLTFSAWERMLAVFFVQNERFLILLKKNK